MLQRHPLSLDERERCILIWTIGAPDPVYWMWVFGFPHNRQWKEIGRYVTAEIKNDTYSTNENKSIAGYSYLFDINLPGYYIHIMHPQSFRYRLAEDKFRYWMKRIIQGKPSNNEDRNVAEIYAMPNANIDEIRANGY